MLTYLEVSWSSATVAGSSLELFLPSGFDRAELEASTRNRAYDIISTKGSTTYGVAAVVTSISQAILFDERRVFPLSHWQEEFNCCLSMPVILGKGGIASNVNITLSQEEKRRLEESARTIADVVKTYQHDGEN
jgi:L-lactate dehydrogenase